MAAGHVVGAPPAIIISLLSLITIITVPTLAQIDSSTNHSLPAGFFFPKTSRAVSSTYCRIVPYTSIPDPRPPNPLGQSSWAIVIDGDNYWATPGDELRMCEINHIMPYRIHPSQAVPGYGTCSIPCVRRYPESRVYNLWPPATPSSKCTQVVKSFLYSDTHCSLPPSCGAALTLQIQSTWYGENVKLCYGINSQLPVSEKILPNSFCKSTFPKWYTDTSFQQECNSFGMYDSYFRTYNSTHLFPTYFVSSTVQYDCTTGSCLLTPPQPHVDQQSSGALCINRIISKSHYYQSDLQGKWNCAPSQYVPYPQYTPNFPVSKGWCLGSSLNFTQGICTSVNTGDNICTSYTTVNAPMPWALFRCDTDNLITCYPADYEGSLTHPFVALLNTFLEFALSILVDLISDIEPILETLLALAARAIGVLLKFLLKIISSQLELLVITCFYAYRLWRFDAVVRPTVEAVALLALWFLTQASPTSMDISVQATEDYQSTDGMTGTQSRLIVSPVNHLWSQTAMFAETYGRNGTGRMPVVGDLL